MADTMLHHIVRVILQGGTQKWSINFKKDTHAWIQFFSDYLQIDNVFAINFVNFQVIFRENVHTAMKNMIRGKPEYQLTFRDILFFVRRSIDLNK